MAATPASQEVAANLASTGYQRVELVPGKVEVTLPGRIPDRIAVLRLTPTGMIPRSTAWSTYIPGWFLAAF